MTCNEPDVIDFAPYSLPALLKMARDVNLIDGYEYRRETALIAVGAAHHTVSHQTARSFLETVLAEWWLRQDSPYEPPGEIPA